MASESSAVLDLNDADEETDAPSVLEDCEGAPLIMEPGMDIAVKVDAPLKQLSTLETFVTYRVRCVCARWSAPAAVRRRYNHFKALHRRLCAAHQWSCVPPPPPLHSARQQLDRYSPAFVAVRTLALHAFLDRIARHPILTHSDDFRIFLTAPDDELEKAFRSEGGALSLWGLGSLYAPSEKPNNGARVKDPEFAAAADYLQSLQQKLTMLCSLTTKLYQGSMALSTELMGMKRACDQWSAGSHGPLARALGGAANGARGAACALARVPAPHSARAALPLLAAYAAALRDKLRQRDNLHAAHVSEAASESAGAGEAHNRLAVAEGTLRAELEDWTPKTRADVKRELAELAQGRVRALTQVLQSWETALKLATEPNMEAVFKTVSRSAVSNLSPSRGPATPEETERDFDDLGNYSDSDTQDIRAPERERDGDTQGDGARERDGDMQDDCKSEIASDPLQSFSDVDLSA